MLVSFRCRFCGEMLKAPIQMLGKTAKCNKCLNPVKITLGETSSQSHSSQHAPIPAKTISKSNRTSWNTKKSDEKYCGECGKIIKAKAEICPMCGVRQYRASQANLGHVTPSGRNRVAAALFAIFLGGLGIHKFYLGQIGFGILYLIFYWTGIPFLIGFVEGIIYLTMTDSAFEKKYG